MTKTILLLTITLTLITGIIASDKAFATEQVDQSFTGPFDVFYDTKRFHVFQQIASTSGNMDSIDLFFSSCDYRLRCISTPITNTINVSVKDATTGEITTISQEVTVLGVQPTKFVFPNTVSMNTEGYNVISIYQDLGPRATFPIYLAGSSDLRSYEPYDGYPAICDESGFCRSDTRADFGFTTYYNVPDTPEEQTEAIVDEVFALLESGDISTGNANSLTSTLENAIDKITADNTTAAEGMLGSFINKIQAMIGSDRISPEDGQALIDAAQAVIDNL